MYFKIEELYACLNASQKEREAREVEDIERQSQYTMPYLCVEINNKTYGLVRVEIRYHF